MLPLSLSLLSLLTVSPDESPLKGDIEEIKKMIDQIPMKAKTSPHSLPPHLGDIRHVPSLSPLPAPPTASAHFSRD